MWDDYVLLNRFALCLLVLSLLTLLIVGWRAVGNRPAFAIQAVVIRGDTEHLTQTQLADLALVKLRGNFFSVDLTALKEGFEALPWVRHVSLRRRWPLTITVDIDAFHALARWGDGALLSTEGGDVFVGATDRVLPVLWGPPHTERQVFEAYQHFAPLLKSVGLMMDRVVLSEHYAWTVSLSQGITIELGRNTPTLSVFQKMQRFVLAYPTLSKQLHAEKKRIQKVDLRYPEGFAINITHE